MKQNLLVLVGIFAFATFINAQTPNTPPLPNGETIIGGHLHAAGDELWTDQASLYFNYRGNAATTHFWNLGGGSGKSVMTILSNGNVGIGTPSPLLPLHISGLGVAGELNLLIQNTGTNGARTYLSAFPGKSSIQTDRDFSIMTDYGGWSDKFVLTNQGRAGIGTGATDARLTVNGALRLSDPTGWNIGFGLDNDPPRYLSVDVVNSAVNSDPLELVYNRGSGVKIGNGGAPDKFLKVYGTAYAKEVNVTLSIPGPDYVFEKDYNLLPLSELETYINENKHLPEVPSAKEMEANGLNLKEMNLTLLKKVEELTLHLIEKEKKMVSMEKRIEQLEKQ